MTKEEFFAGMEGILAFYKAPATQEDKEREALYLSTLFEAIHRIEGILFPRVVKKLSQNQIRGQKPTPRQFWEAYNAIKEDEQKTEPKCSRCKQTGWVYCLLYCEEFKIEDVFVKPCPTCQPNHPYGKLPLRDGWTFVADISDAFEWQRHKTVKTIIKGDPDKELVIPKLETKP